MTKKKWIRPQCTRIKLVPEEAVLTGCKKNGSIGPSPGDCMPGGGRPCRQPSS